MSVVPHTFSCFIRYFFEIFLMTCTYFRGHQCKRRKRLNFMVKCANDCPKMYCAMCLWNRYGIRQVEAERDQTWTCPMCTNRCNCAACLSTPLHHPLLSHFLSFIQLCLPFFPGDRGVDPKQHEVLAAYRALLEISVVVPPAFSTDKSEAVAGVCDAAPKPGRSQGYSVAEMERAKDGFSISMEVALLPISFECSYSTRSFSSRYPVS